MATHDHDTDPQSPMARFGSTDPGLGDAAPGVRLPPEDLVDDPPLQAEPENASIESLLDGITGPRPLPKKTTRETRGEARAAYQTSHKAPVKHDTPPLQPAVLVPTQPDGPLPISLEVTHKISREEPRPLEPMSTRPVTRRADAVTVHTRRSFLVPLAVALVSAGIVAAALVSRVLARDAQARSVAAQPATPSDDPVVVPMPSAEPPPVVNQAPPPAAAPASIAEAIESARAIVARPAAQKPASSAKTHPPAPPPKASDDDLKRQILH